MGRAFSRLLGLKTLVTIVVHLLAVVAHNMRKVFSALWHSLAPRARHGGIRTANGCSLTLGVGRLSAVSRCVVLFCLFNPVVVCLSTSLSLIIRNIIDPIALFALGLLSLEGLQLYCKLLKLVPDVKQPLLFKDCLLHRQVKCKEEGVGPSGLRIQRHLLLEHINLVDQLVHHLVTPLTDALVVLKNILGTYVRKAQVIEKESLKFLPDVVMIYPHWVFPVPGITGGVLKVAFCQHHLVFYALVCHRPRLIHVLTCLGELLQFQIGFTFVR